MRNLVLYPESDVPNGAFIFFISEDGDFGLADVEFTWSNGQGSQILYTAKETAEELANLEQCGFKLERLYCVEPGFPHPYGNFHWCHARDLHA